MFLALVYINSTPERYLKFASDIDALRKLPSYIALRKFSDPPQLSDLTDFTMDEQDFKQLKDCKPSHCEVQLPTEAMEEFQHSVNWSAPDANDQANRLAQQMALQALLNYQQGGNAALGTIATRITRPSWRKRLLLYSSRSNALPVYLPELREYLLNYPKADSGNIQSEFYWEKVNFGLKPTLRMVQAIVYQGKLTERTAYAVAVNSYTRATTSKARWT